MAADPKTRQELLDSFKRLEHKGYLQKVDRTQVDSSSDGPTPVLYEDAVPPRSDIDLGITGPRSALNRTLRDRINKVLRER